MVQMVRSGAGTGVLRYSPVLVACYFGRPYNVSADALGVCRAQQFWIRGVSCAYWRIVIQSCIMPIMARVTGDGTVNVVILCASLGDSESLALMIDPHAGECSNSLRR